MYRLLFLEARDEYDDDFDRMREASLKSRQEKAREELAEVTKNVELMNKNLASAKEQVSRTNNVTCLLLLIVIEAFI